MSGTSKDRCRRKSIPKKSRKQSGGGGGVNNTNDHHMASGAIVGGTGVVGGASFLNMRISLFTVILIMIAVGFLVWVIFFNDRGGTTSSIFSRIFGNLTNSSPSNEESRSKIIVVTTSSTPSSTSSSRHDPLTQIYTPPERVNPYITTDDTARIGVPINQYTRRGIENYEQVGILTRQNTQDGKSEILPIFGRRSPYGGDKWNYYTMTNSNIPVKIPLSFSGRDCTDDTGCSEASSGDSMYIPALEGNYTITIYRMNSPRYLA